MSEAVSTIKKIKGDDRLRILRLIEKIDKNIGKKSVINRVSAHNYCFDISRSVANF